MKLSEYIKEKVFEPRLKQSKVLVVHDPDHRYREIVQEMESKDTKVVYGDKSTIEPRQEAQDILIKIGKGKDGPKGLVVYRIENYPLMIEINNWSHSQRWRWQRKLSPRAMEFFSISMPESKTRTCRRGRPVVC